MPKTPKKPRKKATLDNLLKVIVRSNRAIDDNFSVIHEKIKIIDQKINKLGRSSSTGFGKVGKQLKEIKTEVLKIQRVSGYSDQFDNMTIVKKGS